jgi:hypothetical protein
MLAPLRNILLFFYFLFILEVGQVCVSTILNIPFLPLTSTIGSLCKYVILFIFMLDSYTLSSFEKI